MFFTTLDAALADIAERSFYESATVTPVAGGFEVEDDFTAAIPDDSVMWSYDDGMELPDVVSDHSRLMEPCERFATAGHVRYNLDTAVAALEDGEPVAFAYVEVHGYPTTAEDVADDEAGLYDGLVGWALLARVLSA